ncbi:hypothetical protein ACU6T4_02900 [Avibacterium paragallinarum]|uniref:hypothetical protein n=1 Tax=Avibacterium paragallinarum TaxID=728 RepID=UPI00021AD43A|nr:hypothetical protein [Avibacterium paragallinarum]QIR11371.1 hypothetical protein HBL79_03435 [Avibacterium paragallinarum]QJE09655.1 hypothetical protein HHJ62_04710 [Avibacterium paragallinarum]QJE11851.1 hypothetical protein HHJ61_04715 [Avibacterium paragallinarum]QJE14050.1 hypothetical protein HHJ60_04725 [Avibacterium paragallinarum]QJE16252.1 hypothetical protein HHJ59_04720 [Avibacterium paragallinarum]
MFQKLKSYRRLLSTVEIERQYGGILHRTLKIEVEKCGQKIPRFFIYKIGDIK